MRARTEAPQRSQKKRYDRVIFVECQVNRVVAAVTLGMLTWAFLAPTHVLGDTAVYGRAYPWGESSLRVNAGREIVWFVDSWEIAQQAMFAIAAIACVTVVILSSSRALLVVALALLGLIGMALQRSFSGDGVMRPLFAVLVAWTVAVLVMTMLRYRHARVPTCQARSLPNSL